MMTPWVSFDGKNCGSCKHLNERGYCNFTACIIPCTVRTTIPEVKPQTNGDRIRSMTDEELASYLARLESLQRPVYARKEKADWLDWLKQEAEP